MTTIMYNVYVGQFEDMNGCKAMQKQLNEKGFEGVPFNLGMYFSLRVITTPNYRYALEVCQALRNNKFESFILNV